eukprot:gene17883-biopygen28455
MCESNSLRSNPQFPGRHRSVKHASSGCVFDIFADPTEHDDLAAQQPAVAKALADRLSKLNSDNY